MCTALLPPGGYPIAVNKYIISYQNFSSFNTLKNVANARIGKYTSSEKADLIK